MFYFVISACFKDVIKANDVGFYIDIRMIDRITDTGLGSKVDYYRRFIFIEDVIDKLLISNASFDEDMLNR